MRARKRTASRAAAGGHHVDELEQRPVREWWRQTLEQIVGTVDRKEDIEEVVKVLRSGWITSGPKVEEFEKGFARYIGCKYAVALSSCTAALHLALILSGIGEGDEVITGGVFMFNFFMILKSRILTLIGP